MAKSFSIRERVRWSDADAAKIIFYGAYIRFFELAESEMFRSAGLTYSRMYDDLKIWLPRVHIQCDFQSIAKLDDLLEVTVHVSKIGGSSIHLSFQVTRVEDGETTATAQFVLVSVDRDSFAKVSVPSEIRAHLEPFERNVHND